MAYFKRRDDLVLSPAPSFSEIRERFSVGFPSSHGCIASFPGFVDVHVHLREPGFLYKETVATGTLAAAAGGYTDVCPMPNVSPVPDSVASFAPTLEAIGRDAVIRVHPYGAITKGEDGEVLADMADLAPYVVAFSDDGHGVASDSVMEAAMSAASSLGKIIAAHCEDLSLRGGGVIHDGGYARAHSLPGIPSGSEWRQVERDIALVRKTKARYHVCHVSTKESVALIRAAKAEGLDITCETAPHYLVLDESDLCDAGDFKMNPPIRTAADREALIEGALDGTVDMIATDHAPHSAAEKAGGLRDSLMGVVGLECAFPILYTRLVKTGVMTLDRLVEMMSAAPARRFGIEFDPEKNYSVWDLGAEYVIDPEKFVSKGRSTPFRGATVFGKCKMTVCDGRTVWLDDGFDPV